MTNKPLIALGVVTALAMVGGEAIAADPHPCEAGSVQAFRGQICTLGDKTLSGFNFLPDDLGARVTFSTNGLDSVTLSQPGLENRLLSNFTFGYTITATAPQTFQTGSASITLPPGPTPHGLANVTMAGVTHEFVSTEAPFTFANVAGLANVVVLNAGTHTAAAPNSVTNEFTQVATPEPMSLSLFGLGLGGLALVRRRRS